MTRRFNFTKAALDNLPTPETGQRLTFQDAKTQGLQIRVAAGGAKTFSLYRRVKGGSPERITLGRYPAMTIEVARRKAAEGNAAIEGGANPADAKRALRGEPTFNDLAIAYFEKHADVRNRSSQADRKRYELHLKPSLGSRKVSTVNKGTISAIHAAITSRGHLTQANRVLALASSIFTKSMEWGTALSNPCVGISRNREKQRDRFLQSSEMERFFNAVNSEPNDVIRDYIWVSLLTGARRSNVLAMRWGSTPFSRTVG